MCDLHEPASTAEDMSVVCFRISPLVREGIKEIMRLGHYDSVAEALRASLSHELFYLQHLDDDWRFFLARGNHGKEVVWRPLSDEAED